MSKSFDNVSATAFCQLKLALKVLRSLHILCFFLDDMEVSYFFIYVFNFFIQALLHPVVSFFFEIIFDFLKFNLIPWVYFLFFWTHFFLKSLLSSKNNTLPFSCTISTCFRLIDLRLRFVQNFDCLAICFSVSVTFPITNYLFLFIWFDFILQKSIPVFLICFLVHFPFNWIIVMFFVSSDFVSRFWTSFLFFFPSVGKLVFFFP